jgi:16S rRNA (guanine1207-N2)-methyltransferase
MAGPNRGGIKGFIEDASEIVGPCEVTRIKAGHRLAISERSSAVGHGSPSGDSQVCETTIRGQTVRFATRPGVFSHGELDAGTRALIETMAIRSDDTVLDLGCGCGIVGAVAAQTARRVVLVDSSAVALEAARATCELSGVTNRVQVLASDCASAVRGMRFDVVATNPPFHQGLGVEFDVAQQFVRDAAEVLAEGGGRLYLVANRFIRYERVMSGFSQVTTVYEDNHFRVLEAKRR